MDTIDRDTIDRDTIDRGTIAISGSASGIGAATAERFRAAGHRVIGIDLHDAEVLADLSAVDGRRHAIEAVQSLAPDGLDGLVAGAGLGPQERPPGRLVAVNYFGAVTLLEGLLPLLSHGGTSLSPGGAAVVICSNSAGITPIEDPTVLETMAAGDEAGARGAADALHGAIVYGATKLALARWLRHSVQRWADRGVRINAVAPGPVETPLFAGSRADPEIGPLVDALPIPFGTISQPRQIAAVIAFLLGPDSGNCHGSILFSDGGTDALLRPDAL